MENSKIFKIENSSPTETDQSLKSMKRLELSFNHSSKFEGENLKIKPPNEDIPIIPVLKEIKLNFNYSEGRLRKEDINISPLRIGEDNKLNKSQNLIFPLSNKKSERNTLSNFKEKSEMDIDSYIEKNPLNLNSRFYRDQYEKNIFENIDSKFKQTSQIENSKKNELLSPNRKIFEFFDEENKEYQEFIFDSKPNREQKKNDSCELNMKIQYDSIKKDNENLIKINHTNQLKLKEYEEIFNLTILFINQQNSKFKIDQIVSDVKTITPQLVKEVLCNLNLQIDSIISRNLKINQRQLENQQILMEKSLNSWGNQFSHSTSIKEKTFQSENYGNEYNISFNRSRIFEKNPSQEVFQKNTKFDDAYYKFEKRLMKLEKDLNLKKSIIKENSQNSGSILNNYISGSSMTSSFRNKKDESIISAGRKTQSLNKPNSQRILKMPNQNYLINNRK